VTLFPYTTLFRSIPCHKSEQVTEVLPVFAFIFRILAGRVYVHDRPRIPPRRTKRIEDSVKPNWSAAFVIEYPTLRGLYGKGMIVAVDYTRSRFFCLTQ
jgi:hypothetical protein